MGWCSFELSVSVPKAAGLCGFECGGLGWRELGSDAWYRAGGALGGSGGSGRRWRWRSSRCAAKRGETKCCWGCGAGGARWLMFIARWAFWVAGEVWWVA